MDFTGYWDTVDGQSVAQNNFNLTIICESSEIETSDFADFLEPLRTIYCDFNRYGCPKMTILDCCSWKCERKTF